MTKQTKMTPQELVEIAQVVESDKNWRVFVSSGNVAVKYNG